MVTWSALAALLLLVSAMGIASALIDKDYNPMADDIDGVAREQMAAEETGAGPSAQPDYLMYGIVAIAIIAIVAFVMKGRKK